jgi:hypothetical protein
MLVDLENETYRRLTDDAADQLTPRFFPDGKRVVFSYYPEITPEVPNSLTGDGLNVLSEMDFLSGKNISHGYSYDIWEYNIETGWARPLVQSSGDDTSPLVMSDGNTLIYTSDESGINNVHAGNINTREFHRVTDVLGGIFAPDINEITGRITFSGFRQAGYDIYISDDLTGMLGRHYNGETPPPLAHTLGSTPYDSPRGIDDLLAASNPGDPTGGGRTGSMSAASDSVSLAQEASDSTRTSPGVVVTTVDDPMDIESFAPPIIHVSPATNIAAGRPGSSNDGNNESQIGMGGTTGGSRGTDEEFSGGTVKRYKTRLSPDFIGQGAGVYFSTGFGFGMSNSVALSDILGNHRLGFAFNLYSDISESDFLISYYYLKKRIDYGLGARIAFSVSVTSVCSAWPACLSVSTTEWIWNSKRICRSGSSLISSNRSRLLILCWFQRANRHAVCSNRRYRSFTTRRSGVTSDRSRGRGGGSAHPRGSVSTTRTFPARQCTSTTAGTKCCSTATRLRSACPAR